MGAFDRSVLNVAGTTGRGWLNENEHRRSNTSGAGTPLQWRSNTPICLAGCPISPPDMTPPEASATSSRRSSTTGTPLPADHRPLLVVSGESLGSFGSESTFHSAQDMAQRTDGGLYVGPAGMNPNWQTFVAQRDAGSPAHLPIYNGGQDIRFSRNGINWPGDGAWEMPRIGYLNMTKRRPVTWLDTSLALNKPDWLRQVSAAHTSPRR